MALCGTDGSRKFQTQYSLEMENYLINKDITCVICKKIALNPHQTYCGCPYCHKCIVHYLAKGDKYCRGGKEECKDEKLNMEKNVSRSAMLNKKILNARVYCPNKSCPYVTELNKMEEHLRECVQQPIECPYTILGCDIENSSKDRILKHLNDGTFSHSQLLIEYINNLKNEINGLREDFNSVNEVLSTKDLQMGEKLANLDKQGEEMAKQRAEIDRLKEESEQKKIMMEDVKKELTTLKKKMVEEMKGQNTAKRESTVYPNDLRAKVNKLTEIIEKVNVGTNTKVAVGQMSFTVDKFGERKTTDEEIASPYFYSHTNGYKLRLRIYPGGIGDGRGTHLSVFFHICQGEYDDVLPWPCRHTFTVGIANQRDGVMHASATYNIATIEDDFRQTFAKPINKDNDGLGRNKFVSHGDLQSVMDLVMDDSVIVRCVIKEAP